MWFTESATNKIGRITTDGAITEFPIPTASSDPRDIIVGPDGALWFSESVANNLARITTNGTITEFPIPTASSQPFGIAVGPDGALWFIERTANRIGRMTVGGVFTNEYPVPTAAANLATLKLGPDGALWFVETVANKIGRITVDGTITEFTVPTAASTPNGIAAGPDGAMWFVERTGNKIGRITTSATPPGGRGFTLTSLEGRTVGFAWSPGTGQTGYALSRRTPLDAILIPVPGGAGAVATTDVLPAAIAVACYQINAVNATGAVLATSDVECIALGSASGQAPPPNFRIGMQQTPQATLAWDPVPGATRYLLFALGTSRIQSLPATTLSAADSTGGLATCYGLLAMAGTTRIGQTNILCGVPGQHAGLGG